MTDDELLERLRNFDSDSPYEVNLIEAAVAAIERLRREVDRLETRTSALEDEIRYAE